MSKTDFLNTIGIDPEPILELLKPGGRLCAFLKEFESRPQQAEMMESVISAFNDKEISLIEAGTGTGKSIAYLIPAVIKAVYHKERTLISTKTINLQEQLIQKDLPLVSKVLGVDFKAVLVKGMGNYLCLRKLQDSSMEELFLPNNQADQLRRIAAWGQQTKTGSKSDLPFNPFSAVWEKVNCEADTCTFRKCPFYQQCHFFKAREEAKDAQILVSNHHLLFADLALRAEEENYEEAALLPSYKHVVVDEAHHIEEVATDFFAQRVSRTDLMKIMGRLASEKAGDDAGRLPLLKKKLIQFYKKGPHDQIENLLNTFNVDLSFCRREVIQGIADLFQALSFFFEEKLSKQDEENKLRLHPHHYSEKVWEEEVVPAAQKFLHSIKKYVRMLQTLCRDIRDIDQDQLQEQALGLLTEVNAYAGRLDSYGQVVEEFVFSEIKDDSVRWIESHQMKTLNNIHLIEAKLDVSPHLVQNFFSKFQTIILCSATLSTNQNFGFMKKRLGLDSDLLSCRTINEKIFQSPFNFQKQSLLLVPSTLPPPNHKNYVDVASESILQAIKASHGNCFILFTSYTMLKQCYEKLSSRLRSLRFPIMKQGDDQRQALLCLFRKTERSVLFATDSFWEGVDVSGEALRCVILVKLPFKVPSEPIFQARSELIAKNGGDPFRDYALPGAVVKFKQGFGRLIRHKCDRGVVVVLDTRLMTKGYGKIFLRSLPDCPKLFTQDLEKEMKEFYRRTYPLVLSR
ncbi:MAG: putative ATP-dependent helicase DinG [Chlamydiae bacterium]|nr:putative ATP-dependent helicase DinG [Chlamydiota bacterium]